MANVATPSAAYERMELRRKLCRDLMGGTEAMRAGRTDYLLKFDSEDSADYLVRLNDSFLVGFFEEAVLNVVGKVFSKTILVSDDTPPEIHEGTDDKPAIWSNLDLAGAQGDVFLYNVAIDAVVNGVSFVLIDMPKQEGTARTVADEANAARPYWKHFHAQDVIEALVIFENGIPKLQRLRVRAQHEKPEGEWGSACVASVLVYERGDPAIPDPGSRLTLNQADEGARRFASFRVFERSKNEKGEETWSELTDEAGRFAPPRSASSEVRDLFIDIPVVAFYTEKIGHFEADPPLRDSLGDLCLQHWRKKSRLDIIDDAVNYPIFTFQGTRADFEGANYVSTDTTKGVNTREFRIGPFTILFTGGEGRDIKYLEHSGVSIEGGDSRLQRIEQQIRQASAEPFLRQSLAPETAHAVAERAEHAMTRAQVWAASWQSSINEGLRWTAAWLGLENGGTVTFGKGVMESLSVRGDFSTVLELWEKGLLTDTQAFSEAKRYQKIDPTMVQAPRLKGVGEQSGSFDILTVKQEPVQPRPETTLVDEG